MRMHYSHAFQIQGHQAAWQMQHLGNSYLISGQEPEARAPQQVARRSCNGTLNKSSSGCSLFGCDVLHELLKCFSSSHAHGIAPVAWHIG